MAKRSTTTPKSPARKASAKKLESTPFPADPSPWPPAMRTLEDHCAATLQQLHSTLVSRGATYGSFFENSEMAISIQEVLQTTGADYRNAMHERAAAQAGTSDVPLSLIHLLLNATNMIAAKQSRLFATPLHADSWLDLAGYAILAHAAISMKGPKK